MLNKYLRKKHCLIFALFVCIICYLSVFYSPSFMPSHRTMMMSSTISKEGKNTTIIINDEDYLQQNDEMSIQTTASMLMEEEFNLWSYRQRSTIFQSATPMWWGTRFKQRFKHFFNSLGYPIEVLVEKDEIQKVEWWKKKYTITNNENFHFIYEWNICNVVKSFQQAGSPYKRHVLFVKFDENWGAFSSFVQNRTYDYGPLWLDTCSFQEIMDYINHNSTLGVITTQFQQIDHPKVHSLPIGITPSFKSLPHLEYHNRTQLLMVNAYPTPIRKPQIDTVLQNFYFTVNNTYGSSVDNYVSELSRSKFVLSPAGQGWDCYRNWEALSYGAIPIIERYNRTDGWFRTFHNLPVLWVSHINDVTPVLLKNEYIRLSQYRNYSFEKLTKEYWIQFVLSLTKDKGNRESSTVSTTL